MAGLSFEDACRFLFARQGSRINWSLGPTTGLLAVLGHPEQHFPSLHVAGTNGKGSTCTFAAAALRARGLRVGVYTSPHLVSVRGVHVAVIEVGLGGRLDATNVITPLVSVVTKIAQEHTDYLGPDLAGIAREKAGVAKPWVPFVTGEQDPAVRQVLVAEAARRGATPVIEVDSARPPAG